jgi:hypothetical protein
MNPVQVQDYISMIRNIHMYLHNTNPDEIALIVFDSELTDDIINYIENLQNNFLNTFLSMTLIHKENLIKASYAEYHKKT